MSAPDASSQIVMQAKGLVKRFGQVTALDGADFELRAGEILAVIGDNGAGKSSLIKCLSGASIPDEGEIQLDGQIIHFKSPIDARRAGIETVYQDLAVAPAMTIAENLFLGPRTTPHRHSGFVTRYDRQEENAGRKHCTHERPKGRHTLHDAGGGNTVRRSAPMRGRGSRRRLCPACGHHG